MEKQTFSKAVEDKAKELKIKPEFLHVALLCISGNENVQAREILINFGKWVINDLEDKAISQSKGNNKRLAASGSKALEKLNDDIFWLINISDLDHLPSISEMMDLDNGSAKATAKNYHVKAWNIVADHNLKISKYYRKANSIDFTDIFKFLCPDLLEEAKQIPVLNKPAIDLQLSTKLTQAIADLENDDISITDAKKIVVDHKKQMKG